MDLNTLPPPNGLTVLQARNWLRRLRPAVQGGAPADQWLDLLERAAPPRLDPALAPSMLAWIQTHGLSGPYDAERATLSLDGVAVTLASGAKRRTGVEAWDRVHQVLERAAWWNGAPDDRCPLVVEDVLLFGSMLRDQPSYGDADLVVVFRNKNPDARDEAERWLQAVGLSFAVDDRLGFVSWAPVMTSLLVQGDGFVQASADAAPLRTLLDHDAGFSCVSLLGRTWEAEGLAATNADAHVGPVLEALDHGTARAEHVRQQLALAVERAEALRQRVGRSVREDRAWHALERQAGRHGRALALGQRRGGAEATAWWAGLGGVEGPRVLAELAGDDAAAHAGRWLAQDARSHALWQRALPAARPKARATP